MSDTPRTDGKVKIVRLTVGCVELPENHMVSADFARQLERELAEAQAEIERRKADYAEMNEERLQWLGVIMKQEKLIEQMKTAMEAALKNLKMQGGSRTVIEDIEAALSAAERVGK